MEGNVVFGTNEPKPQAPPVVVSQPVAPPPQVVPLPPTSSPPPPPISMQHGMFGGLLPKIVIAVIALIVIGVIIAFFVLPRFAGRSGSNGMVTVTYWGLWEPESVMQPIIDDFQKKNPTIKVVYEQRDIKRYKETLLTRVNGGDGPDLFRFHNSWTRSIKDTLSPLPSTVISPDEFKKQYYPVVQSDMTISGGIYGIPLQMDTLEMFVSDKILEDYGIEVPRTWEEFINVTNAVTVSDQAGQTHTYGAAIGSYDNISRAPDLVSVLFAQSRIDLKQPTKAPAENYAEALRFYTNFATGRDRIARVWDPNGPQALEAFAGGNVAIYFGYSWDIFALKAKSPDLEFSIHPIPYLVTPVTVASYWADGVSSKGKHQKEAMLFLAYLAKKETQQQLYTLESKTRLFGELPARRDLAKNLEQNKLVYPFLSGAETAVSSYFVSDTYDNSVNEQMNGYLGNAVRSVLGNTSPESASDTLLKGVSQVLSKYGIN